MHGFSQMKSKGNIKILLHHMKLILLTLLTNYLVKLLVHINKYLKFLQMVCNKWNFNGKMF